MRATTRAAAVAILIAAGAGLTAVTASAAPAGPFSPLRPIAGADHGLELARHDWGRRCYRRCHIGRHGRLWCTWHCYRPRRWW